VWSVFGSLLLLWHAAMASANTEPQPPAELLIEAEDFKIERGPWRVIGLDEAYYAATLSNTFISRQKLLSAPPQTGLARASYRAVVPATGRYRIWSRYECPSRWSVEHTLRIEQAGRVVFERKYGQTSSTKLWPMRQGLKPMAEFPWGSGDNVVWEPSPELVSLRAGPARFTLIAGPQPEAAMSRGGAAERHVDGFLLTTDAAFGMERAEEQTWHVLDRTLNQKGQAFLRVTNPADGARPLAADVKVLTHSPYWRPRGPLLPAICRTGGCAGGKDDEPLAPGQSSPWVPIGQALDTTNMQELVVSQRGAAPGAGSPMIVEISADPAGRKILRRVELRDGANAIVLEIPHDLRGENPLIRTIEEWHADLLGYLRGLPPPRGGPPREIPVLGIMGPDGAGAQPPSLAKMRAETGLLLGRNTWKRGTLPADLAAQAEPRRNLLRDIREIPTASLEKRLVELQAKGELDQVAMISLGDEIGVGGFDPKKSEDNREFRRYLSESAVAAPVPAALSDDLSQSRAYYWSQHFAVDRSIDQMAERTRIVEQVMGKTVRTGANYAPHPQYFPTAGAWVRMFRRHGMTMPWSEDWVFQVPEASPLVSGYLCDVMRAAGRVGQLPVHMYTMPHFPGQTTLAHGNRVLDFFGAVPIYEYTENWVAWDAHETWRAMRDIVFDVGQADDILARGRVRRADVALVISDADDIWEQARHSSIYNFERKNLYHLLRHAQVTVDFVADEDIADPKLLGQYKVLVLCARHLARTSAEAIKRWVAQGGRLIGVAGSGTLDEYEAPLGLLDEVFGIGPSEVGITEKNCWAKEGLAWLPALAEVRTDEGRIPALAVAERVVPTTAVVRLRTGDGEAAAMSHPFERGTATRFSFFPGAAYLQTAIPRRPFHRGTSDGSFNHFLPTEFNHAAARLILDELRAADISLPVVARTDGSTDLALALDRPPPPLDVGVVDAQQGTVVVIANYSGNRIGALTVTLRESAELNKAYGVRAGPLIPVRNGGSVSVTLPVDWAEMVVFRRP
jgi:hypothetical protein